MSFVLDVVIVVLLLVVGWVLVDAVVGEWREEDGWEDEGPVLRMEGGVLTVTPEHDVILAPDGGGIYIEGPLRIRALCEHVHTEECYGNYNDPTTPTCATSRLRGSAS